MLFQSPDRSRFGGAILAGRALADVVQVTLAGMDTYIEIQHAGIPSPGGGKPGTPPKLAGRVRCTIEQGTRGSIGVPLGEGPQGEIEWEVVVNTSVQIAPDDRLAWPAFLPQWQPNTAYVKNQGVSPDNWTSGSSPLFVCVQPGISGNAQPLWPAPINTDVSDGGVVWRMAGWGTLFEIISIGNAQSHPSKRVIRVKELG